MIDHISEAWQAGRPVQYLPLLGHDSEWTDYTQKVPPALTTLLVWRVKPLPPSAATAEEARMKIDLTPPAGYTAEELERDNPHNAQMNDMSLETSEADARPYHPPHATLGPVLYVTGTIAHHSVAPVASRQQITDHLESLRTDPLLLAQIDAARMSPEPKVTLKVKDGLVMGVGIDLMREWDTVTPSRPVNAMVTHAAVPGEVLGNGHPDWPDDLTTYAERKAYQRGVADAKKYPAELGLMAASTVQMECLVDYVKRSTHWAEGGATRHDAILALKQLGVWK